MWEPRRRATGARIHLPFPVVYSSLNLPGTKWQPGDLFTMRQQSRPSQVVEKTVLYFKTETLHPYQEKHRTENMKVSLLMEVVDLN